MRLASYPSQWLNLVCKIPMSLFSLQETNTIGYYGARYYAPWLGRWMSPDPAGTVDGLNSLPDTFITHFDRDI